MCDLLLHVVSTDMHEDGICTLLFQHSVCTCWCKVACRCLCHKIFSSEWADENIHQEVLDSKQKIPDCCLWLHHKQNRCKWLFFLGLCSELQTLEKISALQTYLHSVSKYHFTLRIKLTISLSFHHGYSSRLNIFPATFPSRLFVPSSINTVDMDLCSATQGLDLSVLRITSRHQ